MRRKVVERGPEGGLVERWIECGKGAARANGDGRVRIGIAVRTEYGMTLGGGVQIVRAASHA